MTFEIHDFEIKKLKFQSPRFFSCVDAFGNLLGCFCQACYGFSGAFPVWLWGPLWKGSGQTLNFLVLHSKVESLIPLQPSQTLSGSPFESSLGPFGSCWELLRAFGSFLGAFWDPSGSFCKLSTSLLEAFWEPSENLVGTSGNFLKASGSFLEASGSLLGVLKELLKALWEPFGSFPEPPWSLLGTF